MVPLVKSYQCQSNVCSPVVVLGCLCGISDLSQHLPPVATHHSGTLKGRVATLARCTGYQECSCHLLVSNSGIRLPFDDQRIILLYTGCTGSSWFCHWPISWMSALKVSLVNDGRSRQEKPVITSDSFSHWHDFRGEMEFLICFPSLYTFL